MEEVLLRFHHIGERIFELIDDKNLMKCKNVSKTWRQNIPEESWIRIIKAAISPSEKWKEFFKTYNSETLCEMATTVYWFPLGKRGLDHLHFIPNFEWGTAKARVYQRLCEFNNNFGREIVKIDL